jgi:hypothetical protein
MQPTEENYLLIAQIRCEQPRGFDLKLSHSTNDLFGFRINGCGMFSMLGMLWISGELTNLDDEWNRPFSG